MLSDVSHFCVLISRLSLGGRKLRVVSTGFLLKESGDFDELLETTLEFETRA